MLTNFKIFENIDRKLYCDMDGVLCDFMKKFTEISGSPDIEEYANKYGWKHTWNVIEKAGVEFWSELEWTKDGKILWSFLEELDNLEILTGSPLGEVGRYADEGKDIWVKKNCLL